MPPSSKARRFAPWFCPAGGAKLASLVHKPPGTETLWQKPGIAYRQTSYGDSYGEAEFSGMDEMFPTINPCYYEAAPFGLGLVDSLAAKRPEKQQGRSFGISRPGPGITIREAMRGSANPSGD